MKNKRRWHSIEEKRRIVAGYERSGLRQREYVRKAGIGLSTLGLWSRQGKKAGRARFVEVDVGPGSVGGSGAGYRLTLSGGMGLEFGKGFDAGELRILLATLQESR